MYLYNLQQNISFLIFLIFFFCQSLWYAMKIKPLTQHESANVKYIFTIFTFLPGYKIIESWSHESWKKPPARPNH